MRKTALVFLIILVFSIIFASTSVADTRILEQRVIYCESGEPITNGIEQYKKVEVTIKVLVSEDKDISLFTGLEDAVYYFEEDKISENRTVSLTLGPGTHTIRLVGRVPMASDDQEITLLASDNLGRYITSTIISPYIQKTTAYTYIAISGASCSIIGGLAIYLFTRGKLYRMKTTNGRKSVKNGKKAKGKLKSFLEIIAPSLNAEQRRKAKILMKELGEILRWQ
jgi:hypothetical protein